MKRKQQPQPEDFPIEDYDELRVSEITPLLQELYDDELETVRKREVEGANRGTIINKIDVLLGDAPDDAAEPPDEAEDDPKLDITHQFCIEQAAESLLGGDPTSAAAWTALATEIRTSDAATAASFEAIQAAAAQAQLGPK